MNAMIPTTCSLKWVNELLHDSAPHYKCHLLLPNVDRKIDVSRYLVNKVKTSNAMTKFQSSLNFDEIFDLSFQEEVFRVKI